MPKESPFDHCSIEDVYKEINKKLTTDELRSLWGRVQEELKRKGPESVATYLDSEFTQLKQDFDHDLDRLSPLDV